MTFDLFDSPELLDIQRIGFYRFLNQGIPQLLTKEFPIKVKNGSYSIHVFINEKNVQLIAPEDDPRDCILKMKTYSCKLYAQVQIVCKKSSGFSNEKTNCRPYSACSKIVYQSSPEWIFLGQLPMMTKRGHFIINGSPRVIVHQVVRAPGIYFQKLIKKDDQNRARFYGDIIPLKGVWVRLQMTKKGRIEAKFKKGKKVEVEFLQKCLEIIENQINLSLNFSDRSFETKNFLRPPLHCTARVLGAKNAFFAQGKVRKDKSGNWSKWLGRQAFFYSTPKLKRCKNLCFQFAKNSSLSFYGDFTSLGIKKKNNEISFPIDDNYSNVLEKRKTRAESKAEHDAFIHTYDKLYRTSQDKELEEWQKKKKNLNFFKGSSLHKNVSSKKSSFCKKSGALTSCKVKNFACPYLRAPTKQLQGITKKGGRFGHQEQNHDLTFCKTNAFRSLSSTENAFKRKKCSENLFATFKMKSRYDLGVVGREKINNKFGLTRCTPLLAEPTLAVSCRASLTSPFTASCLAMPRRGREAHAPSCPFLQNSALYVQQAKSKQGKQQVIGSRVKPRSKWFGNQEILLTDQCNTQLTALDLCSASLWLHKLRKGEQNSDDIDHSQNRRVRTSGDLLQTQFENGVDRLKNVVSAKLQERRGGNLGYSIFSSIFKTSYKNRYNRKFFFKERFKTTFSHVEMTPFVQNFPKNLKWKIGKKLGFLCKNSITFESFLPFSNPAKNLLSTKFYNFTALQGGARYDSLKKVSTRDILFVKKKIIVKKISKRKIAIAQLVVSRKFLVSKRCTYSGLPYSNLSCPALRVCFGFKGEKKFLIGSEKDCFVQGRRNCQYQKSEFRLQNQEIVSVYKKNSYKLSPKELFSTKPITGALREFFGSNPLSQYMDQTNPLAEITHKRRISSLGIGGVSRESAGMAIRGIHPTHYGRICPIETPEGKNAGLVNSLAFYTKVDINGFLKTPYYRVFKGQIQSSLGFSFCSAKEESLTSLQIAPSDLQKSWNNILRTKLSTLESVPVRVTDNLLDVFKKENPYKVKLIAISPIQMISVATSLIPFLEHNDANRALMGSNMQRQAVPLMISERPIVGTGLESNVIVESGHITESKVSGFASHVTANKIVIDTLQENLEKKLFSSKGRMFRFPNFFKDRGRVTIAIFAVPQRNVTRTLPIVDWHVKGHGKEAHANLRPSRAPYLQCLAPKAHAPFCPFLPLFAPLGHGTAVQVGVSRGTASCAGGARQSTPFTEGVGAGSFATKIGKVRVLGVGRKLTRKGGRQNKKIFTRFAPISFGRKNKICADFKKKQFFLKSNRHSLTTFSRSNQNTCITEKPLVREFDWVQKGDVLTDCSASNNGELAVGKNVLLAYIPWEGYNFEDAIVISERLVKEHVYTSLHIERYVFQAQDLKDGNEWFTKDLPGVEPRLIQHLEESGLPKIGSFLKEGDILVGKTRYLNKKPASPYERLLCDILGEKNFSARNKSLYVPKGVEARVVYHKVINVFENEIERKQGPIKAAKTIHLFLGEKRVIQVGDKISGRHGNKGVISTILPRQDMPYLPDGTPIDLILNPLGVPSRMNVGQVLECLLGLAASYLNQHFKIAAFDERYGVEASKSVVFLKLYQARLQSGQNWLFQVTFPGKTRLIDGRSGECFDQWITVGKAYILKLIHMVSEKIHARSTGPYALITQQPLRGRSNKGGQRLGEMEVWALEGFGAAYTLQELLTKKSDDFFGRKQIVDSILPNPSSIIDVLKPNSRVDQTKLVLGHPEIFKVLLCELQALCLDLGIYVLTPESFQRSFLGVVH